MSPKPPWPMSFPSLQLFLSVSFRMKPSGRGLGRALFFGGAMETEDARQMNKNLEQMLRFVSTFLFKTVMAYCELNKQEFNRCVRVSGNGNVTKFVDETDTTAANFLFFFRGISTKYRRVNTKNSFVEGAKVILTVISKKCITISTKPKALLGRRAISLMSRKVTRFSSGQTKHKNSDR